MKYLLLLLCCFLNVSIVYAEDFKSIRIPIQKVMQQNELEAVLLKSSIYVDHAYVFKTTDGFLGKALDPSETVRVELLSFSIDEDEETDIAIFNLDDPGYVYCRAQFVQLAGSGARTISIVSKETGLDYHLWVEGRKYYKGRNWAEGYIYVALVKEGKYEEYVRNGVCELHDIEVTSGGM